MKKLLICCVVMVTSLHAQHPALSKVLDATEDVSFGAFCAFIEIPQEQSRDFAYYYETQVKKIKRVKSSATRQARTQELRDKGRSALEVEQPKLYSEFMAYEAGTIACKSPRACVAQNARLFLSRYGAWHEFKKSYAQSQGSIWARVKGFASDSKQRVAGWFAPREEPIKLAAN